MVGYDKAMVKDLPGTTRDATDTPITYQGKPMVIIDTAGMRRPGKANAEELERWSVVRTERAIERADIVGIVMDATDGVVAQDKHVVSPALEGNKGIFLIINKWDEYMARATPEDRPHAHAKYLAYLRRQFPFLSYATPLFTSAVTGKNVDQILETAVAISIERHKRVSTGRLNTFIQGVIHQHAPTGSRKSHNPKIYYASQISVNPPTFFISVNNPAHFHFSYPRYLENQIREKFGFFGTPIVIQLTARTSMFAQGSAIMKSRERDAANKQPAYMPRQAPPGKKGSPR
jgi:GTPase